MMEPAFAGKENALTTMNTGGASSISNPEIDGIRTSIYINWSIVEVVTDVEN